MIADAVMGAVRDRLIADTATNVGLFGGSGSPAEVNGVYNRRAPDDSDLPYIVVQEVSVDRDGSGFEFARLSMEFQVSIYTNGNGGRLKADSAINRVFGDGEGQTSTYGLENWTPTLSLSDWEPTPVQFIQALRNDEGHDIFGDVMQFEITASRSS